MIRLPPYHPSVSKPIWDIRLAVRDLVVRYRLEYRARAASWYVSAWVNEETVFVGKRLSEGSPLLWRYRVEDMQLQTRAYQPVGRVVLFSRAGDHSELDTQDGLGWTHCLYWGDPADMTTPEPDILEVV